MTSRERAKKAQKRAARTPWHNRTSTLLGASVVGLAAIALVVASATYLAGPSAEPEQAPVNYVGPTSSTTTPRSSAPTTTATITTTRPPITSDINPDLTPTRSEVPDASSRNPATTTRNPNYRPPRTRDSDSSVGQTTRSRPRSNVTRTLAP